MTRTIAIIGATLCGWLSAAALARRLPRADYRIVVIDDGSTGDGLGDFTPIIALPPVLAAFHADLGLDEQMIAAETRGGHALGLALAGWRRDGAAAFLSYGETGAALDGIAFHQLAGRLRSAGQAVRLADYSVAALAAQAGRFGPLPHALHVDAGLYAGLLRPVASRLGVARAGLGSIRTDDVGSIDALILSDGEVIEPLLVLDCTGAASRLASAPFEDWADLLPCNRTVAEVVPATHSPPYAQVEALDDGWIATLPIEGAEARLACRAGGTGRPFRQGRRTAAWTGNCIALGAAACVLEPLHPTAMTLLLRSLARLIQLWPADRLAVTEAAAFNRAAAGEQLRARDFVIGQYAAAGRLGKFWDARRAAALPEPLAAKLDLFRARGRLPMFDDEIFEEEDWAAVFDAMGLVPRRHDALADRLPIATIERHFAGHRARIIEAVRSMPLYARFRATPHQREVA